MLEASIVSPSPKECSPHDYYTTAVCFPRARLRTRGRSYPTTKKSKSACYVVRTYVRIRTYVYVRAGLEINNFSRNINASTSCTRRILASGAADTAISKRCFDVQYCGYFVYSQRFSFRYCGYCDYSQGFEVQ